MSKYCFLFERIKKEKVLVMTEADSKEEAAAVIVDAYRQGHINMMNADESESYCYTPCFTKEDGSFDEKYKDKKIQKL